MQSKINFFFFFFYNFKGRLFSFLLHDVLFASPETFRSLSQFFQFSAE